MNSNILNILRGFVGKLIDAVTNYIFNFPTNTRNRKLHDNTVVKSLLFPMKTKIKSYNTPENESVF
jgi:hypothetical protein